MDKLSEWKVIIESSGRCGTIAYHEHFHSVKFDFEFGGGEVLVIVWGPAEAKWDTAVPWALGRMNEILQRVSADIIRQKAPTLQAEIDLGSGSIVLRPR